MNRILLSALAFMTALAGGTVTAQTTVSTPAAAECSLPAHPQMPVVAGETFPDTDGRHVNAHGGMIMEKDGTYYWYGENRAICEPGKPR